MIPLKFPLLVVMSCLPLLGQEKPAQVNIFVSLDGDDANPGIESRPKATIEGALETLREHRREGTITPQMPVNLWIRGGTYRRKSPIVLDQRDQGSKKAPFRISAYRNERVIFDAGLPISYSEFSPAQNDHLPEVARGKVVSTVIKDEAIARALSHQESQISFGPRMMTLARFPNTGFSIFGRVLNADTPKVKGTRSEPKGAKITINPTTKNNLRKELAASPRARLCGYMSADWLKVTQDVVSGGDGNAIRLVDGSAYGIRQGRRLGRVYLENILCELDSPGEWYYDTKQKVLYLWPTGSLKPNEAVSAWAGNTFFQMNQCAYTTVERITFQNLHNAKNGTGAINVQGGHHNLIAGCTFRNIASFSNAFNIGGHANVVRSCDIYDVNFAARLSGGSMKPEEIVAGENVIENCHFTQVFAKSFYGKVCSIGGAGNIFRNNLMHNHNGQVVTMSGVDHVVERNEVFNSGVEEGDGGCFYQGAMSWSWGNVFRHNFFHHIMCNPQMYPRAAIFSDDGDMGDEVIENVFYKAGEGFKVNAGAGHYATGNVSMYGVHALQVLNGRSKEDYSYYMDSIQKGSMEGKRNLLMRGFSHFGREGWKERITPENWTGEVSPYWLNRYPRMREVFDSWARTKNAARLNTFEKNTFYGYTRNPIDAPKATKAKSNRNKKRPSGFKNPDALNFASRSHNIPFEEIGLYRDTYRKNPPEKDAYRRMIAEHWKNRSSAASGRYEPAKVNRQIYYNTGLVIARLRNPSFAKDLKVSP